MPRLVSKTDTKTVSAPWWGEKEHAVLRRFAFGDRQALTGAYMRVGGHMANDDLPIEAQVDIEQMNLAILLRGIVSWTDAEGAPLSVDAATVAMLEEKDATYLLTEINAFNPRTQRSEEDQANFRD